MSMWARRRHVGTAQACRTARDASYMHGVSVEDGERRNARDMRKKSQKCSRRSRTNHPECDGGQRRATGLADAMEDGVEGPGPGNQRNPQKRRGGCGEGGGGGGTEEP